MTEVSLILVLSLYAEYSIYPKYLDNSIILLQTLKYFQVTMEKENKSCS